MWILTVRSVVYSERILCALFYNCISISPELVYRLLFTEPEDSHPGPHSGRGTIPGEDLMPPATVIDSRSSGIGSHLIGFSRHATAPLFSRLTGNCISIDPKPGNIKLETKKIKKFVMYISHNICTFWKPRVVMMPTGATGGCYDKLRCHQLWNIWHHDDRFIVFCFVVGFTFICDLFLKSMNFDYNFTEVSLDST